MLRLSPLACACILLVLCPPGLAVLRITQQPAAATTSSKARSRTKAYPQLTSLQETQRQAFASGDPVSIATATQALIDHLQQRAAALGLSPAATPEPPKSTSGAISSDREPTPELLAAAYNDLGTAEARQGHFEDALQHFQQSERWHNPSPTLLLNLASAAFRLSDFKESNRALTLYLKTQQGTPPESPQTARAQMMLAMSLFSEGQFAEASKAFSAISAATMADPRAAYSWAFSLAHSTQQQHANQIADLLSRQALPGDVMSLVCHIYVDTEDYEQSVSCYRRAYQADPTLKLAHFQAGESLIRLDRPAEAVPELQQELILSPVNPEVQYSLAFALLQTSHKQEAVKLLKDLTDTHPEHAQAQYQLGKTLLEEKQAAESIKHLELAAQLDPNADYIRYQLQTAYRTSGRTEDADRELRVYRELKTRNRQNTSPQ